MLCYIVFIRDILFNYSKKAVILMSFLPKLYFILHLNSVKDASKMLGFSIRALRMFTDPVKGSYPIFISELVQRRFLEFKEDIVYPSIGWRDFVCHLKNIVVQLLKLFSCIHVVLDMNNFRIPRAKSRFQSLVFTDEHQKVLSFL